MHPVPFSIRPLRSLLVASVVMVVWLLSGCSASREVAQRPDLPDAFPNHSLAQIQRYLQTYPDTLTAFTAKASLSIHTPEQSGRLSADIQNRRGDSLYMALSPGLGIEAARILVTPDSFFVYDRIKKQLHYGSLAYAAAFLPLPVEDDDVFLAMLDLAVPDKKVAWSVEPDSAAYRLTDPTGRQRFTIDPTVWRVVRYEAWTPGGALFEERAYDDYDLFAGLYLPRRILLNRPLDDTRINLYYRDLTLNPPDLSFTWRVGSNADRILVDESHGSSNQ